MQAAMYERTGSARDVLSLVDIPLPVAGAGEVRVKLAWSGVNPSDVKSRQGRGGRHMLFLRIVPHSDGAGVIDQVGTGVPEQRFGERVWTWNAAWQRPFGTAAEYVVLPAEQAVPLPANVELSAGACLGIRALTALHAMQVDGGVQGKRVLVSGGAGAVGHYAIQFAKLLGAAQVIATVSSAQKAALSEAVGADVVVNYKTDDVAAKVQAAIGGNGVDRIVEVDLASNIEIDHALLAPGGEIVAYGSAAPEIAVPFYPMIVKNLGLKFFIVYNLAPADRTRAIDALTAFLQANRLTHNIAARLPLANIAQAHELVESGRAMGNVVLAINDFD
ncbi:MAG: NADPH:quinone reductase [Burkholderiaceae bacterium]